MKIIKLTVFLYLFISLTIASSSELENLSVAKNRVKNYYQNGDYDKDMNRIVDSAITEFDKLVIKPNSAVVFDVDETTLSNMPYENNYDFGFNRNSWDEWVLLGTATAIPQSQKLYNYLINRGIKVIFLTGRPANQYEITTQNLLSQAYIKYDTLICKSINFSSKKAVEYKSTVRKMLSDKYEIIGSVGDQFSDLEGGYTILKIKLPNYMYWIE